MGKELRRYLAKHDELVGPAELAEWMQELFPNGAQGKRRLMEIARTGEGSTSAGAVVSHNTNDDLGIPRTRRRAKPAPPSLTVSLVALVLGAAVVASISAPVVAAMVFGQSWYALAVLAMSLMLLWLLPEKNTS